MAKDWDEIVRRTGACGKCGKVFAEEEEYFATLNESKDKGFERLDFCLSCWSDAYRDASFSFWQARVPKKEEKKKLLVDNDVLVDFFKRLISGDDESKEGFIFVLSLILMRKRILKYISTLQDGDGKEQWIMKLTGGDVEYKVTNPHLDDEQIEKIRAGLGGILAGD